MGLAAYHAEEGGGCQLQASPPPPRPHSGHLIPLFQHQNGHWPRPPQGWGAPIPLVRHEHTAADADTHTNTKSLLSSYGQVVIQMLG